MDRVRLLDIGRAGLGCLIYRLRGLILRTGRLI